jgi:signal transduction histidine kinase
MAHYPDTGQRFRILCVLLLLAAGAVTALGVYAAGNAARRIMARHVLEREAVHFAWQSMHDPGTRPPDDWLIRGYLVAPGRPGSAIPQSLRGLAPGYHTLRLDDGAAETVGVYDQPGGRLYLLFNEARLPRTVWLLALIPVVLAALCVCCAVWLARRDLRTALSPVIALADVVRRWNPDHPDPAALAPEHLPSVSGGDVQVLVTALYNFANRLEAFVERERNFTRDASHELRTPLTVMKVAADVLADEEMTPFAQRSLARIRSSVREMEALIETFLVLARESDTGLRDEDFLANDVVAAEVARYRELLAGKPVELALIEHARFALHAPPRVFAVMVGNLIRNACLYTEHGGVTVEIDAGSVRVTDTGSGMSAEDLERAFQPFYRGSRTGDKGHGIGLAIVRRIADRYDWRVTLESAPGEGTTAVARFPSARPPDAALPLAG